MRNIIINKRYSVLLQSKPTRTGFKHEATLFLLGSSVDVCTVKAFYQNRTWESYQYESVLKSLLEKYQEKMEDKDKRAFKNLIKRGI